MNQGEIIGVRTDSNTSLKRACLPVLAIVASSFVEHSTNFITSTGSCPKEIKENN